MFSLVRGVLPPEEEHSLTFDWWCLTPGKGGFRSLRGPPSRGGALTDVHEDDDDADADADEDEDDDGSFTQAKLPLVGASFSWCREVLSVAGAGH